MSKNETVASKKQTPFNLTMHFLTEYSAQHSTIDYVLANKVFHIPKLVSHKFNGYKYTLQENQLISEIQYKMLANATIFVAQHKPTSKPTDEENRELHREQVVDTFNKRFKILGRFFKIPFEQINKHLEKDLISWVIETTNDRLFIGHEFEHKSTLLENIDDGLLMMGIYDKSFHFLEHIFSDKDDLDYISLRKQLLTTMSHLIACLLDPSMTKTISANIINTIRTVKEKLDSQIEELNTLFVEKYSEALQLKNRAEYALYDRAAQTFFKEKRPLFDKAKKELKLKLTKKERDAEIQAYNIDIEEHIFDWLEALKKM